MTATPEHFLAGLAVRALTGQPLGLGLLDLPKVQAAARTADRRRVAALVVEGWISADPGAADLLRAALAAVRPPV